MEYIIKIYEILKFKLKNKYYLFEALFLILCYNMILFLFHILLISVIFEALNLNLIY